VRESARRGIRICPTIYAYDFHSLRVIWTVGTMMLDS